MNILKLGDILCYGSILKYILVLKGTILYNIKHPRELHLMLGRVPVRGFKVNLWFGRKFQEGLP